MTTLTSKDFAEMFYTLQRQMHNDPEKYRGFSTGIPELDELLGGFHLGWYIIVGGPEKSGKTTFKLSIAHTFAQNGVRLLWGGYEMSLEEMAAKAYSYYGIPSSKFRDVKLDEQDWAQMDLIRSKVGGYNAWWNAGTSVVEDFLIEANRLDVDVVIVDYLQLMSSRSMERQAGTAAELSYISRTLKQWTLNGPRPRMVIAGSQLSREGTKGKLFNSANYFKNSSSLEQDANVAFVISPVTDPQGEDDPGRRKITVVASRHSASKVSFYVAFDGAHSRVNGLETIDLNRKVQDYLDSPPGPSEGSKPW